ncbi:methenyltetrahydrofolate synthase domain-containing protein isoform X2 [Antennarius striatus]|uniref:methenyltetrahydrofolate synthase domain-containing protein isoform X2 n=1 Tax=Antennarius striatus TaxID=241820 RepID=UPI0035AE8861
MSAAVRSRLQDGAHVFGGTEPTLVSLTANTMEPVIRINPGASKQDIRQRVWDYIEEKNLAYFPRPVHNRIPNFKAAFTACARVSELQAFSQTSEVKVDPDKPLEGARLAVLEAGKTLLVPTPRLSAGLFNKIIPPQGANKEQLRICASSQGVKGFSVPVGLDAKVKVDLVVVGSVAVSEKGLRIGKGEGYADMEYAMMSLMGAVNDATVVVSIVHDCQVVHIPEELKESEDLTVDYILTPTRLIKTDCQHLKPQGIAWSKLDSEKLEKIPILKKLRVLEEQAGKDVTLRVMPVAAEPGVPTDRPRTQTRRRPRQNRKQDSEGESKLENRLLSERKARQPPESVRKESVEGKEDETGEKKERQKVTGEGNAKEGGSEVTSQRKLPQSVTTLYLGDIPAGLRVSELKTALKEREATPLRLTWQGAQHRAFLDYINPHAADKALEALQDLSLHGQSLRAEMAKNQQGGKRSNRARPSAAPESKTAPDSGTSDTTEQ